MISKADVLVLVFALVLLPALYARYWGDSQQGEMVRILVGGQEKAILDLNENHKLTIEGSIGSSVIEIRDGQVRFTQSPCRGKQCIHSGWLHNSGEFAACLPNRVSIALLGQDPRFDSINF